MPWNIIGRHGVLRTCLVPGNQNDPELVLVLRGKVPGHVQDFSEDICFSYVHDEQMCSQAHLIE